MLDRLRTHRPRFLGATEGILVSIAVAFVFLAVATVTTVEACAMCEADRLAPWVDIMAGISFVASGLLLRVRRPTNPLWLLMIVAGLGRLFELTIVYFAIELFVPWLWVRNLLLIAVPYHIALAFPTGTPLRGFRWVLWSIYGWAGIGAAIRAYASHPTGFFADAAAIRPDIANAEFWQPILTVLPTWGNINIGLAVLALIVRWWTGNQAIRRTFAAIFVVIPLLLALALEDVLNPPEAVSIWAVQLASFGIPITVALGIVGPRLWEGRLAHLLDALEVAATPGDVESAVRATMEDSSISLVLRRSGSGELVDASGEPMDQFPAGTRTAIVYEGETLGELVHSPNVDIPLIRSIAHTAALTMRRLQLQAEVQAQLVEVRRSRERIVAATDAARRHIERDLHDGAQQSLVALSMTLDLEKSRFSDPAIHQVLNEASNRAKEALESLRQLSRGMYPPALAADGLAVAVEGLADVSPIPVRTNIRVSRQEPHIEATLYFVIAEGLTNAAKYADASSIDVSVEEQEASLRLTITDDGVGGAALTPGSGLEGIGDRVAAVGGTLSIDSPTGGGTRLTAVVPV